MKCIKIPSCHFGTVDNDTPFMTVRRVTDDVAFDSVHRGPWKYATRQEWKDTGRKYGLGF